MIIIYDQGADSLTILLSDVPVGERDEAKPGIILDYDAARNPVSLQILTASRRVKAPGRIEYQVVPVAARRERRSPRP